MLHEIETARANAPGSKVIVLAGDKTVFSKAYKDLEKDKNVFLAGVNNKHLTEDSYIRLIEMMNLTFKLAFGKKVDMNNPNIGIKRYGNKYLFIPKAEPMEYGMLKRIYWVQICA